MNRYGFLCVFAMALIASAACGYTSNGGYPHHEAVPGTGYQLQGASDAASSSAAAASAADGGNSYASPVQSYAPANSYAAHNPSYGQQVVPHATGNTRGNTITSSITYPQNKGEILIHRPAAIIVKRPPTKVVVNHPPLVVKPAPVVLHKPPAVVMRKVYVKHHPRPVKVEPVYVNVVKPPAEKYFVNEKRQHGSAQLAPGVSANAGHNNAGVPAYATAGTDGAAAKAGYQLLSSNHGLNSLASIAGHSAYAPGHHGNYGSHGNHGNYGIHGNHGNYGIHGNHGNYGSHGSHGNYGNHGHGYGQVPAY